MQNFLHANSERSKSTKKKDPIHPIKLFIKCICSTTEDFMHYSRGLKKNPDLPSKDTMPNCLINP